MLDEIVRLHDQGLSAREIAARVGRTRNSVIGLLWRYKKRGPPKAARVMPDRDEVQAALDANSGNLSATSRQLGIGTATLYDWGFRGNDPRGPNRSKDFETYALIEEITESGLSDTFIAERVGMASRTIYRWRTGRVRASPFLAQCVRTVLAQNAPGY